MAGYITSIAINSRIVLEASTRRPSLAACLTGLQVDRTMNVEAVPPAALFHFDRHLFRRPAANRPHRVGWMAASAKVTASSVGGWFSWSSCTS